MNHWLHGMFTALVTPFHNGELDLKSTERLLRWQIAQGVDGIVINSAVGENAALSETDRAALVLFARQVTGRHFPVIAAVGSYSTADTLEEVALAERSGASALLLRMPYYSRPTQQGLVAHVAAVSAATSLEIVLDNDPDRCGVEIAVVSLAHLANCENVVGILERRGDLARCDRIARTRDRRFLRLTGSAETIPSYLLSGGCGAVTGIGNLIPHWLSRLSSAARSDYFGQAQLLQRRIVPLLDLLPSDSEPVLLKQVLAMLHPGFDPSCRLPHGPVDQDTLTRLWEAVEDLPRPHDVAAAFVVSGVGDAGTRFA